MDFQHINVKFYLQNPQDLDPHQWNPVFQSWIRNKIGPELLIDVADYLHVPAGPGMVLVGLECDFALDNSEGRWGLKYNRKAPQAGSNQERLENALKTTLEACIRVEQESKFSKKLKFDTKEFEIFINDRALAPNNIETQKAFEPVLKEVLHRMLGQKDYILERAPDPRERFGILVKGSQDLSPEQLLKNLVKK